MMEIKSNRMKGTARCQVVRIHDKLQEERSKDEVFAEVVAKKEAIREGLRYKAQLRNEGKPYGTNEQTVLKREVLGPFLMKAYMDIDYPNNYTRNLHFNSAQQETFRYVNSENRIVFEAYPMDKEIFGVMVKSINPDYVVIDKKNKIVEVFKMVASRPKLTQTGDKEDESVLHSLDMYNLL